MDFEFSPEQRQLRDKLRRWCHEHDPFAQRKLGLSPGAYVAREWQALARMGLLGLRVPTERHGMGGDAIDAMIVMEELGRALLPVPYAEVALVVPSLLLSIDKPSAPLWLESIMGGQEQLVLAHQEPHSRYRRSRVNTRAERDEGSWRLTGRKTLVRGGWMPGAFIVSARVRGDQDKKNGFGLYLVSAGEAGVQSVPYTLSDGHTACDLILERASAIELVPPGAAASVIDTSEDILAAAMCAEGVGAMEALLELTRDHLLTRRQFGQPLAQFQLLRHRFVDMHIALELARGMSYHAALKLDSPPEQRHKAVSQAKVQLGHSMRLIAQQCIQLHGALGLTDDHPASHYFRRLSNLELSGGDTLFHLGEVTARLAQPCPVFE